MPFKECGIDVILSWRDKHGVLDRRKVFDIIIFADVLFQACREDDALVVGETNKTFVESLVVERGEANAVFRVQTFLLVL